MVYCCSEEMWKCACDNEGFFNDGFVDMTLLDTFLKKCCAEKEGCPEECKLSCELVMEKYDTDKSGNLNRCEFDALSVCIM